MSLFVDLAILLLVAGMARSGFKRGFVFYAADLIGFVGAVVAAVRFHEIPASLYGVVGLSGTRAAIAGGLTIFVPLIAATAIFGRKASRAVYVPGMFTTNRVLGAAFATALGASMLVVALLFSRSVRLPFELDDLLERSLLAPRIVEGAAPAVAFIDDRLGLDLCGGRFAHAVPEVCDES